VEYEMLQNDRILKTMRGKAFRRLWQGATAYLLGLPLFQCAFGQSQWAEEIAENTAWAFTSGMGSLLSNTFRGMLVLYLKKKTFVIVILSFFCRVCVPTLTVVVIYFVLVPVDDIVTINDDTGDIELVFSHIINKSPQTQPASSDGQQHDQEDALASDEQIHDAFGKHFVKLYRDYRDNINTASCAANTNSELELTLQMIPMDYKVLKIGCLPFLSRNIIEEKPNFREEYFAMHKLVRTRGFRAFLDHWMDFANKTTDERGVFMETTVSADILVTCTEQFHVKEYVPNKDSPEATISTIQGDDKYRQVQHLVRMELDFHAEFDRDASHELREDDLRWVKGNWKIVDIDDRMDRIGEWLIPMPTRSSDSQR